jgi:hypothetical protein
MKELQLVYTDPTEEAALIALIFPNEDALKKMLFLVYRDISKNGLLFLCKIGLLHYHIYLFLQRLQNVL